MPFHEITQGNSCFTLHVGMLIHEITRQKSRFHDFTHENRVNNASRKNIGATLAIFQLSGNRPRERDKLNSCTREGANTEMPIFKKKLDIQSTPDPLDVLIPPQTLIKVSSFIGDSFMYI